MNKSYLTDSAGCGNKIIQNFHDFYYRINLIQDSKGNTVNNINKAKKYHIEGSWCFNTQQGYFNFDCQVSNYRNSIIYTSGNLGTNPNSAYPFSRPLALNNDPTLSDVFDKIVIK